jgi:hypothetical protein
VRTTVLATAIAAALTLSAADASAQTKGAATKAEVDAVQAQVQALVERMNTLEAANATLKSQNTELQSLADRREAELDYLKQQTKDLRAEGASAANDLSKVKGADWATKFKWKGDLRMRDENITQERVVPTSATTAAVDDAADRNRARIRARFGFDATVTDNVKASVQIATGSDADPRSTNQTMTNDAAKKSIWIDQAYIDWKMPFFAGSDLYLGKMKYPFWRPGSGQSMFYDNDVNPEGVALSFDRGMLFGTAYGFVLWENGPSNPAQFTEDTAMIGAQLGLKFSLFGGETRAAVHYYDVMGADRFNPFAIGSPNGNTTVTGLVNGTAVQVLAYDYNVFMGSAEIGATLGKLPFSLWADYADNGASDVDVNTAYAVGLILGKAGNPRTWEAGLSYQEIGKDALFAQWIDSDFADGVADADGYVLRLAYAPTRNVVLNGTYFMNTRHVCGPVTSTTDPTPTNRQCLPGGADYDLDYDRIQLDFNYKF